MWGCAKGTLHVPACGFSRQAVREELPSEVPAGWRAEEGKTLSDSTLEGRWPESSCPHHGGKSVLAQHI